MKKNPMHHRFAYGIAGIRDGWQREQSFRSHVVIAGIIVSLLVFGRPTAIWWALAILSLGTGLALELINSALEALIDHLRPDRHPDIRVIKDMASGGVLILNLSAIGVGLALIFELLR